MQKYQILVVEDDKGLNQGIAMALRDETVAFLQAFTFQEAIKIWEAERVDMVLLDINLPDGSGYELLKKIRKQSEIPVLMITANDMEVDEVMGFTLGADDYITKPFSLMVLRARVERMRKRSGETKKQEIYRDEVYEFNFDKMLFLKEGEEVTLSKTEQKLLRVLTQHREQTLTREQLMDAVWSNDAEFVDENALSVAVNRLRRKLESRQGDCPIQTVYGLGYLLLSLPLCSVACFRLRQFGHLPKECGS